MSVQRDYDPLLARTVDSRFVLLGEASHGTHEFYRERAEITKRLIAEQGLTAVAVEADWPDAYRVNLYVRGVSGTGFGRRSSDGKGAAHRRRPSTPRTRRVSLLPGALVRGGLLRSRESHVHISGSARPRLAKGATGKPRDLLLLW